MNRLFLGCSALALALLAGCTTVAPYDYTAFKESKPRSIVVLPPVNDTPDVNASAGVLSQVTYPLAESGYYVLPVAPTFETFKQNGLTSGTEAQATSIQKLHDILERIAVCTYKSRITEHNIKYFKVIHVLPQMLS